MLSYANIENYISLFRGRDDVFAVRWEKKDKSGYMPAYEVDWNGFDLHKTNGGTFKNYPNKKYLKLNQQKIIDHLDGNEVIGIYPLLSDNTSWFLAVDFDEKNWKDDVLNLYERCQLHKLTAYIERSRSGNGGHLWIFFEEPYPAIKSRAIIKHLLNEASINLKLASTSSFDRIFPNQDFHTGKGLGNLIALPLQKAALELGNACFINPLTLEAYSDQWDFLATIKRVTVDTLEEINSQFGHIASKVTDSTPALKNDENHIEITLDNTITIARNNLSSEVVLFLRNSLKSNNPNFFIRKATGQNTHGIAASSTSLEEYTDRIIIPRGYIGTIIRYFKANRIKYQLNDNRKKLPEVNYEMRGQLYDFQLPALLITEKKEMGVIVAPPGSGKTIIGLSIVAHKKQPTLIIVHRRQLFDQWIQQIQSFLGIPKYKIGRITKGHIDIGEAATVAMIQSISNSREVLTKIKNAFGTIIIDECHHVPSDSYKTVLQQLHTYYLYGLTATPIRKNKDEKIIFTQIGDVINEVILPNDNNESGLFINVRDTDLEVPFNEANDNFETLSDILIHDAARNSLITDDIRSEINNGKSVLVLTERKAHIEILNQFLKQDCETIVLSGDDTDSSRKAKIRQIEYGRFQAIITTGQFMGEGIDIGILDCLFLVYPCSFEGKLIQYIGRVQRSKNAPIIYDYRDLNILYLEKMFQKRNRYYNKLANSGHVKVSEEYLLKFEDDRFYIDNYTNAYPVSILDIGMNIEGFQPGVIWRIKVLKYQEQECSVFAEILSYGVTILEVSQQLSLPLLPIEQIRFRTLDTAGLLKSVVLKKSLLPLPNTERVFVNSIPSQQIGQWWIFEKIIKVPFKKVTFGNGYVNVSFYLAAIKHDVTIEIQNPDIRPEFEVIKEYFSKILKSKSISVSLIIKHDKRKVLSYEAASDEINAINTDIIDSVRFEFVRKHFIKLRDVDNDKLLQTFDDLKKTSDAVNTLLQDETALLNEVLKIESAKHYLQLKYLAEKHEAAVLKLRFVLQPFSFIFLASGENKYHIVWETFDSEEATYLWHIDKNKEALRNAIGQIEISLSEMKQTGRNSYIKKAPDYFSRIIHDYSDAKKGFIEWKGLLEERLV